MRLKSLIRPMFTEISSFIFSYSTMHDVSSGPFFVCKMESLSVKRVFFSGNKTAREYMVLLSRLILFVLLCIDLKE